MIKNLSITAASTLMIVGCTTSSPIKTPINGTSNVNSTAQAPITTAKNRHLLDGTSIDWIYPSSGSGMLLSFENGLAQYEWIAGARKGRSAKDIPYNSRLIGDDIYLINWVQPQKPDFITLIFDFKNNTAFSSGLIGYGTERQMNLFLDGTINSVER